ncbi:hypothetical protein [Bacillus sp. FJAT-27264]|nr:hypothetical protein [Bacillus sp. FJAT-27264]
MPSGMAIDTSLRVAALVCVSTGIHRCKLGGNTVIESSLCLQ